MGRGSGRPRHPASAVINPGDRSVCKSFAVDSDTFFSADKRVTDPSCFTVVAVVAVGEKEELFNTQSPSTRKEPKSFPGPVCVGFQIHKAVLARYQDAFIWQVVTHVFLSRMVAGVGCARP